MCNRTQEALIFASPLNLSPNPLPITALFKQSNMAGAEEAVHGGCDNHSPFAGGKSVLCFGQVTSCFILKST